MHDVRLMYARIIDLTGLYICGGPLRALYPEPFVLGATIQKMWNHVAQSQDFEMQGVLFRDQWTFWGTPV